MSGRRTATVVIERGGRDRGGVFVLREMAAIPASEWYIRAMQILVRSGADVPPEIMSLGPAGFITIGIGTVLTGLGKAPFHEVKPLLDELLGCIVSYQPPGGHVALTRWDVIKGQIEEPSTIFQIYEEVVSLHLGFSLRERLLYYRTLIPALLTEFGQVTGTSTPTPDLSSQPDLRH